MIIEPHLNYLSNNLETTWNPEICEIQDSEGSSGISRCDRTKAGPETAMGLEEEGSQCVQGHLPSEISATPTLRQRWLYTDVALSGLQTEMCENTSKKKMQEVSFSKAST